MINKEELPLEKKVLIDKYSKMVMEIEYLFLQNKLFQPIGIELSTVSVNLEVEETDIFCHICQDYTPPAYYRPDTDSIHIFIEHDSFNKRKTYEEKFMFLLFLLYHEASHRLFLSTERRAERDPELWNIATDLEIHNMYCVFSEVVKANLNNSTFTDFHNYCEYIDKFLIKKTNKPDELNEGLFEEKYLNYVAEEIYQLLLNSKKDKSVTYTIDMDGNVTNKSENESGGSSSTSNKNNKKKGKSSSKDDSDGQGKIKITISEYTFPSGKKFTTSHIDYSDLNVKEKSNEEKTNEENSKKLRKTILENTLKDECKKAEGRGTLSNDCKRFLNKFLHVKIDWVKILRNSLQSALEKSDYFSWSRPRTSLYGMQDAPYLPSQCVDFESYGTLIVARDESGSMSDIEIAKAAGIIMDAKAYYKKIIILKHDTEISKIYEIEELDDKAKNILLERSSCGGTSHKDVFEWIKNYHIKTKDSDDRISCIISISDLDSDIEETQDIVPNSLPKIYLAPVGCVSHHPQIKGTIIPVEL